MEQGEFNNIENKENSKPDFRRIFAERLTAMPTIPDEEQEEQAGGFEPIGIKKLKRDIPALLLNMPQNEEDEQAFDLWITDPETIHYKYEPHDEVRSDLSKSLGINKGDPGFPRNLVGARVLEDDDGLLYLLVDEIRSKSLDRYMNDDQNRTRLLDLLQRYGITKVAGTFFRTKQEGDSMSSDYKTEAIIDQDLIGERREDLRLLSIARKYNMTNTQYMRFRLLAKSAIDAVKSGEIKEQGVKILRDVEEIAKEVVGEDGE